MRNLQDFVSVFVPFLRPHHYRLLLTYRTSNSSVSVPYSLSASLWHHQRNENGHSYKTTTTRGRSCSSRAFGCEPHGKGHRTVTAPRRCNASASLPRYGKRDGGSGIGIGRQPSEGEDRREGSGEKVPRFCWLVADRVVDLQFCFVCQHILTQSVYSTSSTLYSFETQPARRRRV